MMIVLHVLIVLFLVSNITSATLSCSGVLWVTVGLLATLTPMLIVEFELDPLLPFNPEDLKTDLRDSLFGQHIASDVVLKAVRSFMADSKPNKPLVLSFHGTAGVGKNHVAKIIARNIYKKGDQSKHVHTFISEHHFPHKEHSHIYSSQLKQWIHGNVSSFPRSMFIFDEMDKMNPQLIDVIKPFLDYNTRVDGVSFHNAIFIFLSNAGGRLIVDMALDFWREGKKREDLWINSKELETKIFNDKNSGFQHSSLIDHYLIDHFIPFLPLELKHVRKCVLAEIVHLKIPRFHDLVYSVVRGMPYFPEEERVFAVKGCKSVRQKLVLYDDE
ncbi:torsin-1A-like [Megalobrama amblycephala]|uniref:torsin-1A-like n=1 Tax=Megalobrama amblycephala TaxID=75352 RepID=UPI0020145985|nr:torsin-1A-like [Megalobrama amblycephala]